MPLPFVNPSWDALTTAVTLEPPCFTRTTALMQQLPILDGLPVNTRIRNSRPPSKKNQSSSFTLPTPSSPNIPSSDSSDSETGVYIHPYICPNHQSTMSMLATVEPTSAKAPVLTEGDITPTVMMDFENVVLDFFISKSVPSEKQVTMIIPGIKDLRIRNWISAEHAHLVDLPFVDFMKEMRANYLHQDWEDQIWNQILTSTLTSSKTSFWNWSQNYSNSTVFYAAPPPSLMTLQFIITSRLTWMKSSGHVLSITKCTRTRF